MVIACVRMKRGAEAWAKNRKVHERIVGKFEGMRRASGGSLAGRPEKEKRARRSLDAPSPSASAVAGPGAVAKRESRRVSELRREW